jgi:hypothetical protein
MRFMMSAEPQNVKSELPYSGRSHLTAMGANTGQLLTDCPDSRRRSTDPELTAFWVRMSRRTSVSLAP